MQGTTDSLYYNADSYVVLSTCVDNNFISGDLRIAFAWYQLVVVFVLPAVTMAYCYTFVVNVLWLSTKRLTILMQADRYRVDGCRIGRWSSKSEAHDQCLFVASLRSIFLYKIVDAT